jgi:hypothetical protein
LNTTSAALSNIRLGAQLPLRVIGSVRPRTLYGIAGEWVSVTNYLDYTIDMIQPTSNDYYRMALPVNVEFESRKKADKTVMCYRLNE